MIPWVLGTANPDKLRELLEICTIPVEWQLASEFDVEPPEETGSTIEANSFLKATYYHKHTDCIAVADDTGLFVQCLHGAPGIHSARFAGEKATYAENRNKLLSLVVDYPRPWLAFFETCLTVVWNGGHWQGKGILKGQIVPTERGSNGFGYDSIFQPLGESRTLAEMTNLEKNSISHRFRAYQELEQAYHHGLLPANLK